MTKDTKKADDKVNTDTSEKNNGSLQGAGLDQHEKASMAQEGPNPGNPNKAGTLPGREITKEEPSPLADQIEAEQLAKYKEAEKNRDNE